MLLGFVSFLFLYVFASCAYVYRFRGEARYRDLGEYLSKGWPIFTPLNCFLYLCTKARGRKPILNLNDFKELEAIQKNWKKIKREAQKLYEKKYFEQTKDKDSDSHYDIGFRTFYKYGWGKFYIKWYGYTHSSARKLCPETVKILEKVPSINGALISVLPPGAKLTRHLDPIACSLRYHLALDTPNSNKCYINVDGTSYSWRDGKALLFDETYLHYAKNDTKDKRLILMCDVDRPVNFLGGVFNALYKIFTRFSIVPNLKGDKAGIGNKIFVRVRPLLERSKELKAANKKLYLLLKYTVNTLLVALIVSLLTSVFLFLWHTINALA